MVMDGKEAKRDTRVEVTVSEGPGKQSSRLKETVLPNPNYVTVVNGAVKGDNYLIKALSL